MLAVEISEESALLDWLASEDELVDGIKLLNALGEGCSNPV